VTVESSHVVWESIAQLPAPTGKATWLLSGVSKMTDVLRWLITEKRQALRPWFKW